MRRRIERTRGNEARLRDPRPGPQKSSAAEVAGTRRCRRRLDKRLFLNPKQSTIEVEQLPGKALAPAQFRDSTAAVGPQTIGGQRGRHQIFSRLTRNALNSGVRAFASPTNGVRALAIQ